MIGAAHFLVSDTQKDFNERIIKLFQAAYMDYFNNVNQKYLSVISNAADSSRAPFQEENVKAYFQYLKEKLDDSAKLILGVLLSNGFELNPSQRTQLQAGFFSPNLYGSKSQIIYADKKCGKKKSIRSFLEYFHAFLTPELHEAFLTFRLQETYFTALSKAPIAAEIDTFERWQNAIIREVNTHAERIFRTFSIDVLSPTSGYLVSYKNIFKNYKGSLKPIVLEFDGANFTPSLEDEARVKSTPAQLLPGQVDPGFREAGAEASLELDHVPAQAHSHKVGPSTKEAVAGADLNPTLAPVQALPVRVGSSIAEENPDLWTTRREPKTLEFSAASSVPPNVKALSTSYFGSKKQPIPLVRALTDPLRSSGTPAAHTRHSDSKQKGTSTPEAFTPVMTIESDVTSYQAPVIPAPQNKCCAFFSCFGDGRSARRVSPEGIPTTAATSVVSERYRIIPKV